MEVEVTIDQIKKNFAVLLLSSLESVRWPIAFLPPGAAEGDSVVFRIEINPQGTKEKREKVKRLIRNLTQKG